jgi:hypothetical protein
MFRDKRGVSIMVGYALLIVVAIGLAAIVYPFLKARLPVDRVECPADLSLSIDEVACNRADWKVTIKLLNRGLFNVTGAYIRFAESGKSVRPQINKNKELYLTGLNPVPLGPGQYTPDLSYSTGDLSYLPENGTFVVEVQPAVFKKGVLVPCSNKIITQTIKCISILIGWEEAENGNEYGCEGTWHPAFPCSNLNDTDWYTKGTANSNEKATYYVNYTTPPNAIWPHSNWTIKWRNQRTESLALVSPCWNTTKLQFKVEIDKTPPLANNSFIALSCYQNTGGWAELVRKNAQLPNGGVDINATYFYEEKMWWQLRS